MVSAPDCRRLGLLDALEDAGVDDESYAVLTNVEVARTPDFEDLRKQYTNAVRKLSKQELHAKIQEIQWPYQLYYLGTILSVIAATASLLLDQPALVIGAMIIAPQASSALAAPAGMLLSDWELFTGSIKRTGPRTGTRDCGGLYFHMAHQMGYFSAPDTTALYGPRE